jgi:hypothetical protein
MIRAVHPGSASRFRIMIFYPSRIPDPGQGQKGFKLSVSFRSSQCVNRSADVNIWFSENFIILQACGLKHLVTTVSGYADTAHTYLLRYKCLVK